MRFDSPNLFLSLPFYPTKLVNRRNDPLGRYREIYFFLSKIYVEHHTKRGRVEKSRWLRLQLKSLVFWARLSNFLSPKIAPFKR